MSLDIMCGFIETMEQLTGCLLWLLIYLTLLY